MCNWEEEFRDFVGNPKEEEKKPYCTVEELPTIPEYM